MAKDLATLQAQANTIQEETQPKANDADRIGQMFNDILDFISGIDLLSYSLTEQAVPNVFWIDGRQVYQLTVTGINTGTTVNSFTTVANIPGFSELCEPIKGYMVNSAGARIPSGFYNSQSLTGFSMTVSDNGDIQQFHAGTAFNSRPITATVIYVKIS